IADVESPGRADADGRLEAVDELLRGLDVVGEDEDLLGHERPGEGLVRWSRAQWREAQTAHLIQGRVAHRRGAPTDSLDDDARLARAGAGKNYQGPVAPLDDAPLGRRQLPARTPRRHLRQPP